MKFRTMQEYQSLSVGPYGRRGIQKYNNTRKGVVQNNNGRIILLSDSFDKSKQKKSDKYNDRHAKLSYCGEKHNTLKYGNKLLNNLVEQYKQSGKIHSVTVFVKLEANNWEKLGCFILINTFIIDSQYKYDLQRIDFIPRRVSPRTQKKGQLQKRINELN